MAKHIDCIMIVPPISAAGLELSQLAIRPPAPTAATALPTSARARDRRSTPARKGSSKSTSRVHGAIAQMLQKRAAVALSGDEVLAQARRNYSAQEYG